MLRYLQPEFSDLQRQTQFLKSIRGRQADVERVDCIYLQKLPFNRCVIQFLYSRHKIGGA